MNMQIGLVRGRSTISGLIQGATRSPYSHTNVIFSDGWVFEAEAEGFVKVNGLAVNNKGCTIDLFEYVEPLNASEVDRARACCEKMVGAAYDFGSLVGFVARSNVEAPADRKRLFCSEAVLIISRAMANHRTLLWRVQPWEISPRDISMSPLIQWVASVIP